MNTLSQSYSIGLVILSYFIAVLASYTALDLGGRVSHSRGNIQRIWLMAGAGTMGLGIWAMHFIAMLALHLPIHVDYDFWIVLISILFAMCASGIALHVVSSKHMSKKRLAIGSLFMGTGIALMHYVGMSAMRLDAQIVYDPVLFAISILVAVLVSAVALMITYRLRKAGDVRGIGLKILAGMVMGAAVAGMHYTGMLATSFVTHGNHHPSPSSAVSTIWLAYAIGIATLIILGITLLSVYVEKLLMTKTLRMMESDQRYKSLFEYNRDGVISYGVNGQLIGMNPAAKELTGRELLSLSDFVDMCDQADAEMIRKHFLQAVLGGANTYEVKLYPEPEKQVILHMTNVPIIIDGEAAGVFFIARDVTEQRQAESKINYLAYHDALTGLPNRRFIEEQLEKAIRNAKNREQTVTVMFLDLDRFKLINDSLGHDFGDLLLREATHRIVNCVGESGIVGRLGGDEFIVLMPEVPESELIQMADQLIRIIEQPFLIEGHELYITTSIGISRFPEDGNDYQTLMKTADTAMYSAKERGKNACHKYSAHMQKAASERMYLQNELNRALVRNELLVYYQPQVNVTNKKLSGMEALVRWNHPKRGVIPPDQFITIAEETGLIVPIGEWVLRTACKQNREWQEMGYAPVRVAVNLSARQFLKKDFVQTVEGILRETGMQPEYLELEVTESTMIDVQRATQTLYDLKKLGVHIAIDDFGTGYSSLSYLKDFPLDRLKIDRSFIRDLKKSPGNRAIVATIITMAKNLDLHVIAEGVETSDELDFLQEQMCEEVQGFFFSHPLTKEDMESYLKEKFSKPGIS